MQPITPHLKKFGVHLDVSHIFIMKWPQVIKKFIQKQEMTYPIQINGKRRAEITVLKIFQIVNLKKKY